MPIISICIPQIGEGLQEARLVATLKSPGDRVKRDEPIYQMETDKAVMDVESPYDGVIVSWMAKPDQVLAIGAEVATIEVTDDLGGSGGGQAGTAVGEAATENGTTASAGDENPESEQAGSPALGNRSMPPRTRAYAKEKGLSDSELASILPSSGKLLPSDIDDFLAAKLGTVERNAQAPYQETRLSSRQRILASRLSRSASLVAPGTIVTPVLWEQIERQRERVKSSGDSFQPSAFTMFAYAVTQALTQFPMFRSALIGEDTLRTYEHVDLGIAVALPDGDLVLAVVEGADKLDWKGFANETRARIETARTGKDQAAEGVTLSLTNMQGTGVRIGVPVVVAPAVATLFLGETFYELESNAEAPRSRLFANLVLSFDHRVVNGLGAAQFLQAVKRNVESIDSILL